MTRRERRRCHAAFAVARIVEPFGAMAIERRGGLARCIGCADEAAGEGQKAGEAFAQAGVSLGGEAGALRKACQPDGMTRDAFGVQGCDGRRHLIQPAQDVGFHLGAGGQKAGGPPAAARGIGRNRRNPGKPGVIQDAKDIRPVPTQKRVITKATEQAVIAKAAFKAVIAAGELGTIKGFGEALVQKITVLASAASPARTFSRRRRLMNAKQRVGNGSELSIEPRLTAASRAGVQKSKTASSGYSGPRAKTRCRRKL